jgi:hypothetical protein
VSGPAPGAGPDEMASPARPCAACTATDRGCALWPTARRPPVHYRVWLGWPCIVEGRARLFKREIPQDPCGEEGRRDTTMMECKGLSRHAMMVGLG